MSYDFLKKAQSQPDLNDFCEYLKKPLSILEEVKDKYKSLQVSKQTEENNIELYHKVDMILVKHLPEMVNNYCNSSFDYRNNKTIDINNVSITPKELLLKNLAKVIEEIELIEIDFNRNNSFNALVQNKVLENYGYKPELSLETGKIVKNNIELANQFDYEEFVKKNQFKKPDLIKKEEPIVVSREKKEVVKEEKKSSGGGFFGEIMILLTICVILMLATMHFYGNSMNSAKEFNFLKNITNTQARIHALYANRLHYKGLNEQVLLNSMIATPDELYTPWSTKIEVSSNTIASNDDSLMFKVPLSKDDIDFSCKTLFKASESFDVVKVGSITVKKDNSMDVSSFLSSCMSGEHENVSLIDKR